MKTYVVEFGINTIYVEAENMFDAEDKAYLEIGYDPDEMFIYEEGGE